MEARLYELIRDYQSHETPTASPAMTMFRLSGIREFAAERPSRYPEYLVDPQRLSLAVAAARRAGEILPLEAGQRDDLLELRIDTERR